MLPMMMPVVCPEVLGVGSPIQKMRWVTVRVVLCSVFFAEVVVVVLELLCPLPIWILTLKYEGWVRWVLVFASAVS